MMTGSSTEHWLSEVSVPKANTTQRMFAEPLHTRQQPQQQPTGVFYSQPSSYSSTSFFQGTTAYAVAGVEPPVSRPYLQVDGYHSLVGSPHLQVSGAYPPLLQQQQSSSRSILIRSPDEADRNPPPVETAPSNNFIADPFRGRDSAGMAIEDACNRASKESYRLPSGKEGSLKHRILRPPSINILEHPGPVMDTGPLSAPPMRTTHSPKQARISVPSSGYHSSSSSSCGGDPPSQLKYPQSFVRGAIIQLAGDKLKPVEALTTEDFVECGQMSPTLRIDRSTVTAISRVPNSGAARLGFQVGQDNIQITVEAPLEHPFFVYKRGWSSCSPERSLQRYGLTCHRLKVGDTCVSITDKTQKPAKEEGTTEAPPKEEGTIEAPPNSKEPFLMRKRKRRWSAPDNNCVEPE